MDRKSEKVEILEEALDHIMALRGKFIIVKYGGSIIGDNAGLYAFAREISFMRGAGMCPIVVHGGGKEIDEQIRKRGKMPQFIDGVRITDEETMAVVQETLIRINMSIQNAILGFGGYPIPYNTSIDNAFVRSERLNTVRSYGSEVNTGMAGRVRSVELFKILPGINNRDHRLVVPVISALGIGSDRRMYNLDADAVAGAIAASLGAWCYGIIMLTDVDGVSDGDGQVMHSLGSTTSERLVEQGVIHDGMIHKVKSCIVALKGGARKAHIINGRQKHALLMGLLMDDGMGTKIFLSP